MIPVVVNIGQSTEMRLARPLSLHAGIVERNSGLMDGENTVPNHVTLRNDSAIRRRAVYLITMNEINGWREKGLVTDKEYELISANLDRRYFGNAIES